MSLLQVNFIIKSGLIRGKPSCAATWTKSFASAEIADSRQILDFQILDPSICAAQTLSHTLNLFSVVQMENLQNHPSWLYVSAAVPMVAPSEGVDDRIRKMGRQQILLSIRHAALGTLRVSGKMGVSCLLRSITSAFQGLGRPPPPSQWAHARKPKAWQRPRSCELRPEPRFPCRRAGHPHAGPQFEAGSRPFQSLLPAM